MREEMFQYIAQVNEINDLMQRSEWGKYKGQELIAQIRQRSERVFALLQSNDGLIRNCFMLLTDKNNPLSEAEYKEMNEFAVALCTFTQYIDPFLALKVREKLLFQAENEKNDDEIIAQLYEMGIASYLLYAAYESFGSINSREKVAPYFSRVVDYYPRFRELSHESRMYVLRSMNNEALVFNPNDEAQVKEYVRVLRRTRDVFTSEEMHELMPDVNWHAYISAVYRNMLRLRVSMIFDFAKQYLPDVKQATEYFQKYTTSKADAPVVVDYSTLEFEYIQKRITMEELIERVDAIYAQRDPELFDKQGIYQNITLPMFILHYEEQLKNPPLEKVNARLNNLIRYVNEYHFKTGLISYRHAVITCIHDYPFIDGAVTFREALSQLMLALHVPTYVHSKMVSALSVLIAKTVLENAPELYIGLFDIKTLDEVAQNGDKIIDFVENAALFHDTGKFYCMDVVTQYSRRLFNDEFGIIKMHAKCGYEILNRYPSTEEFAEVALMHHITYDRKMGYEREFMPEKETVPIVSDIVRISDAMDAATDNIGRCYSACKTFEAIMAELSDTPLGYNPAVMRAISTPDAMKKLKNVLDVTRCEIYQLAYAQEE